MVRYMSQKRSHPGGCPGQLQSPVFLASADQLCGTWRSLEVVPLARGETEF